MELRLKKGQDLLLEGFPLVNCDAVPFFWAGGPAFEDEALKLVPGGPCPGGNMDLTLELNGNFPSGYTPGGGTTCATIYIYLAEDPDNNNACTRITGFELREFQGSQELYLAMGSGRAEMDVALSGKVELESTLECVDNGEMCAPFAAGGYKLAHTFIDEHPPIEPGVWTEDGGDFELFNDRSHIHGSLDEEGCTPHLDWVLRRAK